MQGVNTYTLRAFRAASLATTIEASLSPVSHKERTMNLRINLNLAPRARQGRQRSQWPAGRTVDPSFGATRNRT